VFSGGGTIDYEEFETWMKTGAVPKRGEFNEEAFNAGRGGKPASLAEQAEQGVVKAQQEADMEKKSKHHNERSLPQLALCCAH
jgi:hypothetical protein